MKKEELADIIKKTALLEGHFVLRSGQKATRYFDKYLLESDPSLLREIGRHLKALVPTDTEVLAGLEMGGLALAVVLSLETHIPCVFVRKTAKEYGTRKIVEGCSVRGKKLCVVEDVVTTGGQVMMSVRDMRKEGGLISHAICVIHRGQDTGAFQREGLTLTPLFHWNKEI